MVTISLCMIVKDEEDTLERCLSSVEDLVEEIIIVDTGSTDRTKEVAAKFTRRIYDFKWINDFSAARNFAYGKARKEYILWLDADDVLLPEDALKFKFLKNTLPRDTDAVMMKYNTGFDEQGNVTFSYYRERLTKRSRGFQWKEPVHEYLEIGGKVVESDICITHTKRGGGDSPGGRNLAIYETLLSEGKELSPRGMYYYARELKDNGRHGEAIEMFRQFIDSRRGWVEDVITACCELAKCYEAGNDGKNALSAMLHSFQYDAPRAEVCCQIGYHFKARGLYRQAAFWFDTALRLEKPQGGWGFCQEDCWGYIPSLECAVCFDKLGEYEKAENYNLRAETFKPDSLAVQYNKKYFESRRAQTDAEKKNP